MKPINLSPSFLKRVMEKGYDYAVAEKLGQVSKESAPMSDGKAIHSFISGLYGGKIEKIAISPYDSFRTNEAKAWRDSIPDDTIILKESQAEQFKAIAERVTKHPEVVKLLKGLKIEAEKTITKTVDKYTVKGILDLYATDGEVKRVIDWKFVAPGVFDDFGRKALWQHYDLQASVYDFLAEATHIYFVAIENEAPHRIKVMYCDPSFLESGADKFSKVMQTVRKENWREPTFDIQGVDNLMAWGY